MPLTGYKLRAPRHKVRLTGRLRSNYDWENIAIGDLSRKGLMAEVESPPDRGRYIEIRHGSHIMIGQVVWSKGNRFGVMLAEEIDPALLGRNHIRTRRSARPDGQAGDGIAIVLQGWSDWRWLGQMMQRWTLIALACVGTATLALTAFDALAAPVTTIASSLAP